MHSSVLFLTRRMMLTIASVWLILTAVNTSVLAQVSDNPSNSNAATASSPSDWTQFLRDNMQRWNPYETVLSVGNVGGLGTKWSSPHSAVSSPAVANGIVYIGANDGNLYALNATTGAVLWSFQTEGGPVVSAPAFANGMVYVGSINNNEMFALNATTGVKIWSYTTGDLVVSSPAVANGVVYFGSEDGNVYAVNGTTGALVWSYKTGAYINGSAAVANGVVYIGSNDYNVYALNATTGAKLWSYYAGDTLKYAPAVANGVVYIGTTFTGQLYALNATTGTKMWSYTTGAIESTPAVANGIVYIGNLDNVVGLPTGHMYAFNANTGALVWKYPTGADVESSPAVANGVVYFGSTDGSVYALNAATGAKLWSSYTGGGVSSSPAVVNGTVYVGSGSQISAFALGGATADLFLRIWPSVTTVHQGDLLTYAFPVWNLGPNNADFEVLNTQVPAGTIIEYLRISGTPGLGTCTRPPYHQTGQIVCHENSSMAPNTTWTVRLTVKVTAAAGTVITENAATMADTPDPNMSNNMATVSLKVQ
jgi:outer membrane protein assembly factor BamB